jgi:antitoxin (DNA-binding transcriptional repressor) of toxin-antitoxin stability system
MHQIELDKAKSQLDALIQTALDGEEVVITRDEKPVLRLVPVPEEPRRKAGSAKGMITIAVDFDEPLEDFREYRQ